MPDQKVGRLWPASTKPASARSTMPPRQTAMTTPAGTPMPRAISNAPDRKFHGVGNALGHDAGDASALNEALAQIEPGKVGEIRAVLHQQRAVEAEGVAQRSDLLGGRTFRDQQQGRIAGKPHNEEDDGQHTESSDERPGRCGRQGGGHAL